MNYYRSLKTPEHPEEAISLLSKYLATVRYLIPKETESNVNVLWHPDLHLDNVFVDPETRKITCIVDWQGACVAPLFYQSCVPRMVRHDGPVPQDWAVPSRPPDFDTLSDEGKARVDENIESQILHKYYEAMVSKRSPRHWSVLQTDRELQRKPTWLVTGVWENRDLFFLRQSLIEIVAQWDTIRPDEGTECPLHFTEEELALHSKEEENMDGVGQMLKLFRDQGILPVDGMVSPEDYDSARVNCEKFKAIFLNLAKDEEERELFSKLWPYQDQES